MTARAAARLLRELEARARQQAAVAELGRHALDLGGADLRPLFDEAVSLTASTLGVELCKVLELLPVGDALLLRSGVGWREGLVGSATVGAGTDSQAGYTLLAAEPVVVSDLRTETRFSGPPLLHEHGVVSGLSVSIGSREAPWGVLGVHTRAPRQFSADDVHFVQSVANVLAAAVNRARAEDALLESESRFRSLVEMAPDVIFSLAVPDGTIETLSPAFETITGWRRSDWLGRSFTELVAQEDLPRAREQLAAALSGAATAPYELRVRTARGDWLAGEFRTAPKIEDGCVVEIFGIARDISQRRRDEDELRRSRDELAVVLREVADGISVQAPDGSIVYANDAAARLVGLKTGEEFTRQPPGTILERFDLLDAGGAPFPVQRLPTRRALVGERVSEVTLRFRERETGDERWSIVSSSPIVDAEGEVQLAVTVFRDVTQQMRAAAVRELLAGATELLSSSLAYETTLDAVARLAVPAFADWCIFDVLEPEGRLARFLAHADPAREAQLRELARRSPLDPASQHPVARVLRSGQPELISHIASLAEHANTLDPERVALLTALGVHAAVVVPLVARGAVIGVLSMLSAESGRRYTVQDLDLAEELARRAAVAVDNAALFRGAQHAEARVRTLAEASRVFAEARLDLQAVLDSVARTVVERIGDQCILRLLSEDGQFARAVAIEHRDPATRTLLRDLMERAPQRADEGLIGQVIATGEPLLVPSMEPAVLARVKPEHRGYFDHVTSVSMLVVPLRVRERVIGTLGVHSQQPGRHFTPDDQVLVQELADRAALAIENARLYREAQNAVRVREQFLSIASHELKTPLTSVKGSAQLLDRRLRGADVAAERVLPLTQQLLAEIGRLETLVADLLDATRIQQGRLDLRLEPVDLSALARQVLERFELAPERTARHRLVLDAPAAVIAEVDPARIDQVLTNLVSNALKYSPAGGDVRVSVRAEGDDALLAVRDSGLGIPQEDQAGLFEPFARGAQARDAIGGTGLGLFISAEIVERHHGTIAVDSVPGRGSTFSVRLPRERQGNG